MTTLKVHNIESAPEGSKPLLENSQKSFGMIPGLSRGIGGITKNFGSIPNVTPIIY